MSDILNLSKHECECGKTHEIKTIIVKGKMLLEKIATHIGRVFLSGNVAVISAKSVENYAEIVQKGLYTAGYTVRSNMVENDLSVDVKKCANEMFIPECVRFVIGIGSGSIADITRYIAYKLNIGYVLIATAPSTDSYLASKICTADRTAEINYKSPDMLIIDDDIIEKAPDFLEASGYGCVVSQIAKIFDIQYNKYAECCYPCENVLNALAYELHQFEVNKYNADFRKNLMEILIKISCANEYLCLNYSAVDCYSKVMACNIKGRTQGENSLLASYIILNLYRCFLKADFTDTLIPPNIMKSIKQLEKNKIIDYKNYIKNLDVINVDNYFKRKFIVSEYRKDLYELIINIDISEFARFWRRLYNDAGYWLKSYATNQNLLKLLSLSAEICKGSLLNHMKRIGFLENFM